MSASPFICNVEGSEESLKPSRSRRQLKHPVCSYALPVAVLAVLVLTLTGAVIWMKLFQDCPELKLKFETVGFSGTETNFTSPGTQKYMIFGCIFTKRDVENCPKLFRLKTDSFLITEKKFTEIFFVNDFELKKGATLSVQLNCDENIIDEEKSKLFIYQLNS